MLNVKMLKYISVSLSHTLNIFHFELVILTLTLTPHPSPLTLALTLTLTLTLPLRGLGQPRLRSASMHRWPTAVHRSWPMDKTWPS